MQLGQSLHIKLSSFLNQRNGLKALSGNVYTNFKAFCVMEVRDLIYLLSKLDQQAKVYFIEYAHDEDANLVTFKGYITLGK